MQATQPSLTSCFTPKPVTEPTGLVYKQRNTDEVTRLTLTLKQFGFRDTSLPDRQRDKKGSPCSLREKEKGKGRKKTTTKKNTCPTSPPTNTHTHHYGQEEGSFHINLPPLESSSIHPDLPAPVSFSQNCGVTCYRALLHP